MIQELSNKFQRTSATILFTICFNSMILPAHASGRVNSRIDPYAHSGSFDHYSGTNLNVPKRGSVPATKTKSRIDQESRQPVKIFSAAEIKSKPAIGGPSQPEMSAFKSVGTDNMVNPFTGDFSYNIPLMDVGGYPVNIFYDGGVGMEQEASWVGLGWNINPGNVNRNMRGIPDDFDGTGNDVLKQTQKMKPNITWGVNFGADLELAGIKGTITGPFSGSVGASLGISFNNYLGPAFDIGIRGNTALSISNKSTAEKSAPTLGGGLSINAGSRSGVTFSPSVSLSASSQKVNANSTLGFSMKASTSYNSRSGVKAIQISEQMSFNKEETRHDPGGQLFSSAINFNKPSYIPSIRMPLSNSAYSGRYQVGTSIFGTDADLEVEIYKQKSETASEDVFQTKPMVGYLYMQNAAGNSGAVMDFTRFNDNEVTPSTPVISAPQYAYDVFSIQGEGTGGSIRAYRNDDSYVRDNFTMSKDKSFGLGGDVSTPGHYGGNFNIVKTPSTIGEWGSNNKLRNTIGFKAAGSGLENVYFRNPGESGVLDQGQYDKIGGTDLVRYKLGGSTSTPSIEPVLERFSKSGQSIGTSNISSFNNRRKRTQVINFLNAEEASVVGLDKMIKSYDGTTILDNNKNLKFTSFARVGGVRQRNHISQINVTESNGQRYVYGIPVYNLKQKDFTFTVNNGESTTEPDKVDFDPSETLPENVSSTTKDGFLQITETPAYAHSFLLSGLLSPDYVDVTGDGITEDDLGNAVKFNYTEMSSISKWRTPLSNNATPVANFSGGKRTEIKDDKGLVSYGERESWYLHSIESKTMIALFKLENRHDNKGASGELQGINSGDNSQQLLREINLYNKADLKKNGIQNAKPIKTVHFEYTYTLCAGTPNNTIANEGKLTLQKIYFTFNGQTRANKNQYVFSYGDSPTENPTYEFNGSDRWGTYKPHSANPQTMKNADYPYSMEDKNAKATIDQNAGAWMLKKILLPSGGQMEVAYESDDYAFVQNKRAADMMQIVGFGSSGNSYNSQLYNNNGNGIIENNYAFIRVPEACSTNAEVFKKYLEGIDQIAFKLMVNMNVDKPTEFEYLNSYAIIDGNNCGLYAGDPSNKTIWVKLKLADNLSPLSLTAVEFLREQLPGQAYPGYDVSDEQGLQQVGEMFKGWFQGIKSAFTSPVKYLREKRQARDVDVSRSFARLNDPDGIKYGGGYRVKSVRLKDNWKQMNNGTSFNSEYGQEYDYTTKEIFNGEERTISSGVASYEPSLGGDENPFQTIIQVSDKLPLGPASYGSVEMPVLDAFFPAASVGYSKVTIRSIKKGVQDPTKKSRSGIGRQVMEYYTAKDFPVYYSNTALDPATDKRTSSAASVFFYKYALDSRALSQGFLIETNDMHGKLKSQSSYREDDDKTLTNYTENFYKNTGSNGMNDKFNFVYANEGGTIREGNLGIDVELMTDTREFSVKSKSFEVQGQVDWFPIFAGLPWLPFVWPVVGSTENTYRAVTTTKTVSYHSVLDKVVVIDKGSQVSTENLVYDSETGDVIVNRTNNEFNQPIYSTNYPAWWAYSGMSPAYRNIDAVYTGVTFRDGKITSGNVPNSILESGDELLYAGGTFPNDACAYVLNLNDAPDKLIWAIDKNKNNSSLTDVNPDYYFIDKDGKLFTKSNVSIRIIRSGKRNLLNATAGNAVTMSNPIVGNRLTINNTTKTVSAGAVKYKEKWKNDNDLFDKFITVTNPTECTEQEVANCSGHPQKNINPYCKGLLGNFKPDQSMVFYHARTETSPQTQTNLPANGFLDNFKLFWDFNAQNNLVPDDANTKWVWNSRVNKFNAKGMELETKDALNIYTAAQYGFSNTLPVAITNNSRFGEAAAEGFEDALYDGTLNVNTLINCRQKYFDLAGLTNASIVSGQSQGINPHSGNSVMKVNAGSTAQKVLSVSDFALHEADYNLNFGQSNTGTLINPGINITEITQTPPNSVSPQTGYNDGLYLTESQNAAVVECAYNPNGTVSGFHAYHLYGFKTSHYMKIDACTGTYHITVNSTGGSDWCEGISFKIYRLDHTEVPVSYITESGTPFPRSRFYQCDLSAGIYEVVCTMSGGGDKTCSGRPEVFGLHCNNVGSDFSVQQQTVSKNGDTTTVPYPTSSWTIPAEGQCEERCFLQNNTFSFKITDLPLVSYKAISTACPYTTPIPGSAEMLNPVFKIPANKKMLLSAWVKENCGSSTTPCTTQTYTHSQVTLDFGSGNTVAMQPSGPIIEGWQKIEGEFTAPQGTTSANLNFVNTSGQAIYFDDIRVQPFNANMKTYVYDPINLRLVAEADANNYSSFYEYDDEGTLIRTKAETREGIKTITETRSAKQKNITTIQ